jgi:hypothetical protein
LRQVHRAQQLRRLANLLAALDFLNTDIEQADGGTIEIEPAAMALPSPPAPSR